MDGYMNGRAVAAEGLLSHHLQQERERYYSNMSSSGGGGGALSSGNSNNQHKVQSSSSGEEEDDEMAMMMDLRRGPWTAEEDHTLMSYIAKHGEGRWNSLARCAGLKRTGKSCRLRWLNYLRPDVRRGNITLEEQLLILELHSRWGNRWSKIAQHLPGRTDNEIKNYWRTRVQKHAKQLKCDVNSKQFQDTMRYLWMPRLVERIQAANGAASSAQINPHNPLNHTLSNLTNPILHHHPDMIMPPAASAPPRSHHHFTNSSYVGSENSSTTAASSDSFGAQVSPVSDMSENYYMPASYNLNNNVAYFNGGQIGYSDSLISPAGYYHPQAPDFQSTEYNCNNHNSDVVSNNLDQWVMDGGDLPDNMWNVEDIWHLQQQQFNNNYY
uniref:Uncharacterized protein n=1 Tax=Kalanchoe fedtschenkoi TaxID=63787 RepID=A0A7N0UAR7_KALFE